MTGLILLWVAGLAAAQPLDLRVVPVTRGVVHSIREIHVNAPPAAPKGLEPHPVGPRSDLDEGPLVGAVLARPIGRDVAPSEKHWRFGAVGTPEMQDRLGRNMYELVVRMDDGERREFRVGDPSRFRIGQRVGIRAGEIEPLD
jgi:hypothetical protein